MSTTQKKRVRKTLKKKRSTTVVVIKTPIAAKDTLFPEKVEAAKELLRTAEFLDPRFGPGIGKA
jgi:hypothetical protein